MDKLKMHSPNLSQDNIAKIRALFPGCVTEARDEATGAVRTAVDFDQLRQELSDHIVDGPQERYRLDWPGKREALLAANAPIAKSLRPAQVESVNFFDTENLFIEGDNLEALKLLQDTYLGKVKMIFIDPPYNTGNDFLYRDSFSIREYDYRKKSHQSDETGNTLVANRDSNGRFHSDWLSMMYPRLKLARNLLADDGAIFISIDDNEVAGLRAICAEIFGAENFVTQIEWQKRYTRSNNTDNFTSVIDHILLYQKSDAFKVNLLERDEEANARFTNPDNDPRGPWKATPFLNQVSPERRPNLCYPITNPHTGKVTNPTTKAWRYEKSFFEKLLSEDRLWWGKSKDKDVPDIKTFLSEVRQGMTPINFWDHKFAGNTDDANREIKARLGEKIFDTPKPTKLVQRMIEHACQEGDLVLDFFAGSGTTGEAVLNKNASNNQGLKFILVQLPEAFEEGTAASRLGYKNIAEIAKERIRRAGTKILEGECHPDWNRDVGFRVVKVDTSNMKDVYYRPDELKQSDLLDMVDNVKEGRTAEDLLFQVLVDWGVDLTLPIRRETVQGKTVFFVDDNALVACFDRGITEDLVKELAGHEPLRVVFRDNGFVSDAVKINVEQIFRQLSPTTDVKSI